MVQVSSTLEDCFAVVSSKLAGTQSRLSQSLYTYKEFAGHLLGLQVPATEQTLESGHPSELLFVAHQLLRLHLVRSWVVEKTKSCHWTYLDDLSATDRFKVLKSGCQKHALFLIPFYTHLLNLSHWINSYLPHTFPLTYTDTYTHFLLNGSSTNSLSLFLSLCLSLHTDSTALPGGQWQCRSNPSRNTIWHKKYKPSGSTISATSHKRLSSLMHFSYLSFTLAHSLWPAHSCL